MANHAGAVLAIIAGFEAGLTVWLITHPRRGAGWIAVQVGCTVIATLLAISVLLGHAP